MSGSGLYRRLAGSRTGGALLSLPPMRALSRRYVAGERIEDAERVVRRLGGAGLSSALELLEPSLDPDALAAALIEVAGRLEPGDPPYLVTSLSALGLEESAEGCIHRATRVAMALPDAGRLVLAAEPASRADGAVVAAVELVRRRLPVVQTLPANLLRSPGDARRLVAEGVPLRLVKGDAAAGDVAVPWGEETVEAYLAIAGDVIATGGSLTLGTHDAGLRETLLPRMTAPQVSMLLGVQTDDAVALARRGVSVRVDVPFGPGWYRRWMERLAGRRDAATASAPAAPTMHR